MCATCGCGDEHVHVHADGQVHAHPHDHRHEHRHDREHASGNTVELEARILAKNDALAQQNRGWFTGREILALNLLSAPGAGKTTLLERTIAELKG